MTSKLAFPVFCDPSIRKIMSAESCALKERDAKKKKKKPTEVMSDQSDQSHDNPMPCSTFSLRR